MIAPDSGWVLKTAYDINDSGEIMGVGERDGVEAHFLLTAYDPSDVAPVPLPDSALLLAGIGALGGAGRRSR